MTTVRTEPVTINLGPQHPSTHGVFRLRVTFDGEVIVDVEPVLGYLHRGSEKLAEGRTYVQIVTLTDRMDYIASMSNNLAYVRAVEQLAGIEVPERAQYIRVISAELQRIASHLMATGFLLNDLGALATPLMYCFRERERILDLFEMLCGARITLSYMRPGGVFQDAPDDFWVALDTFIGNMPKYIDELEALISGNEIVLTRTRKVGVLNDEQAIDFSVSGPMLRAAGVEWDLRKAAPYEIYDRLEFDIPIGGLGDTFESLHRSHPRDAREHPHHPAVRQGYSKGVYQDASALLHSSPQRRHIRRGRVAQGRAGLLPCQRRRDRALSLPRACAIVHQHHAPARYADRLEDERPHRHLRLHRHRAR